MDEGQAMIRRGSWNFRAEDARRFTRDYSHSGYRSNRIGFRVVTGPQPQQEGKGEEDRKRNYVTLPMDYVWYFSSCCRRRRNINRSGVPGNL